MEAKGNIRKEVFARRRAATQEEIQEKSRMIYEKITALPEFLDADCFFAYMDFKKEVMTRDLIEKALQMGKPSLCRAWKATIWFIMRSKISPR